MKKNNGLKLLIFSVFFCIYVFPSGLINNGVIISKFIFVLCSSFVYLIDILKTKKIKMIEILSILLIISFSVYTRNYELLMFITLPLLFRIIKYKNDIRDIIINSKLLYICLFFTIMYSLVYFGNRGRYAFTAIKEINQSGLSIFCLSCLLYYKNRSIGMINFIFGLLTISRSYYLSIIILFFYNKFIRDRIKKNSRIFSIFNYLNFTIITSVLFILLGYLFLFKYKIGEIYWGDELNSRLVNIFDYSNFFRFTAVLNLLNIISINPKFLLYGISQDNYIKYSILSCQKLNIPYRYTVPHNLFFAHLRIYGLFSIIETIVINKILKPLINNNNFGVYTGLIFYSCFLGAGFYSYWLYISIFLLIIWEIQGVKTNEENYKKVSCKI